MHQDAGDIFQAVCVSLLCEPRHTCASERALPKWLIQTSYHECLRHQRSGRAHGRAWIRRRSRRRMTRNRPAENVVIESEEEQTLRAAIADMPERCDPADPHVVLRNAYPTLQRDRPRTWPRHWIDRIHPRTLPASAEEASREEGILMSVQAARKTEVDALIERLLAFADSDSRKQYIAENSASQLDRGGHEPDGARVAGSSRRHRSSATHRRHYHRDRRSRRATNFVRQEPARQSQRLVRARSPRRGDPIARAGHHSVRADWRSSRTGPHAERLHPASAPAGALRRRTRGRRTGARDLPATGQRPPAGSPRNQYRQRLPPAGSLRRGGRILRARLPGTARSTTMPRASPRH